MILQLEIGNGNAAAAIFGSFCFHVEAMSLNLY